MNGSHREEINYFVKESVCGMLFEDFSLHKKEDVQEAIDYLVSCIRNIDPGYLDDIKD